MRLFLFLFVVATFLSCSKKDYPEAETGNNQIPFSLIDIEFFDGRNEVEPLRERVEKESGQFEIKPALDPATMDEIHSLCKTYFQPDRSEVRIQFYIDRYEMAFDDESGTRVTSQIRIDLVNVQNQQVIVTSNATVLFNDSKKSRSDEWFQEIFTEILKRSANRCLNDIHRQIQENTRYI
jgi:hypothetical protein